MTGTLLAVSTLCEEAGCILQALPLRGRQERGGQVVKFLFRQPARSFYDGPEFYYRRRGISARGQTLPGGKRSPERIDRRPRGARRQGLARPRQGMAAQTP